MNLTHPEESAWIVDEVQKLSVFQKAKTVAAFFPLKAEPDISPLLSIIIQTKKLLLPLVTSDTTMHFVEIKDLTQELQTGHFGIQEPLAKLPMWQKEIDLFLVPGKRFSRDGARHGHGKGYYDRLLVKYPHSYKVGLAFSTQIRSPSLKLTDHDIKMNYILATEFRNKDTSNEQS